MKHQLCLTMVSLSLAALSIFIFIGPSSAYELVAAWLMDEGEGEEIQDASGNGHTGQFFGNPEWVDGKIGKGIRFHGGPDHIEVPDPDHKLTPKHITLMAWLNLDNVSGNHSILEQYDWVGGLGAYSWRTEDVRNRFTLVWGTDCSRANGGELEADKWMHVAATYDGGDIKSWIDGEVVATGVDSAKRDIIPSNKTLSLGVRGDTKDTHWMQGTMDEVAIFDEALSEEDIQRIMNKGLAHTALAVSATGKLTTAWSWIKKGD